MRGIKIDRAMDPKQVLKMRDVNLSSVVLGRSPFLGGIKYYVTRRSAYMSESTIYEEERKLRQFAGVFKDLREKGLVDRMDPRHITKGDIAAFFEWMSSRSLDVTTKEKYIQTLDHYLSMFGNTVIQQIRLEGGITFPKSSESKPIRALEEVELRKIFKAADEMQGWNGSIIRGLLALMFTTGCRPKEAFGAKLQDLRFDEGKYGTFYIAHPKGEGKWSSAQSSPMIRGDVKPILLEFLKEREEYLKEFDIETDYLFFNPRTKMPHSGNNFRRYKEIVSKKAGVKFQIKDLRPTLASLTIKGDLGKLKLVSMLLRHSSVKTTEKYYAKIERGQVSEQLSDVWEDDPLF